MKRVVLTGGPGAGKTVISQMIADRNPQQIAHVPEAATQVYAALQTRWDQLDLAGRRAAQRRMYRLQIEQETRAAAEHPEKLLLLLLDRGTVDGAAYWPDGPDDFWRDVGTTREAELRRYDAVILLETSAALGLYDGDASNFCRFEDAAAAIESGKVLHELWAGHPNLRHVNACASLDDKVRAVEAALRQLVPQLSP